jgi:hypothetical protein
MSGEEHHFIQSLTDFGLEPESVTSWTILAITVRQRRVNLGPKTAIARLPEAYSYYRAVLINYPSRVEKDSLIMEALQGKL